MTDKADNPFLATFRRLAVRRSLTPGGLQSGRRGDYVVVTAAAALTLASGRSYAEAEINGLLREWLAGPGAMLATDHVTLRRCLVDCGLLVRDGYGRAYARGDDPSAWCAALAGLAGVDLAAEARAARAAEDRQRSERKASWKRRAVADVGG